jgi:hypothetical protein
MIFCQGCGAENTDDARFCNKCGSAIARPGETGGPLPPAAAAPPAGNNTLSGGTVTLAGIGIASPRKTYAILGVGALLFLVLGAGLAWIAMRTGPGTEVATTETGGPEDDGEVEIGDAIPEGVDVPGGEFVTSGPRVVRPGTSGATATTTPSTAPSTPTTTPSTPGTTTPTTPRTPRTDGTPSRTPHTTPDTPTTPGTPSTTPTTPSTPTDPTTPSTTPSTTPTTPSTSTRDWGALEEGVEGEEPDYEMEHYSTEVRRFIRTYYLQRATSCFEHESATRRDPVRGTVVIGFQITLHGEVEHATIDRNTTGIDSLGTCLRNQVDAWQLPSPPPDAAPLPMQMPFSR